MKLTDESINELLDASFEMKKDVLISGCSLPLVKELTDISAEIKTLLLIPARLWNSQTEDISCIGYEYAGNIKSSAVTILYPDALSDDELDSFILSGRFDRIIIPFAELANSDEYGFCEGYMRVSEIRCTISRYIQLICLFSSGFEVEYFGYVYHCNSPVVLSPEVSDDYTSLRLSGRKEIYEYISRTALKKAGASNFVFFNTRGESEDFCSFLALKGIPSHLVTGNTQPTEIKRYVSDFEKGRVQVLCGTKSLLPVFLLTQADNVFFCGMPYSHSHLKRCMLPGRRGFVVFNTDDREKTGNLIESYVSTYVSYDRDNVKKYRLQVLSQIAEELEDKAEK